MLGLLASCGGSNEAPAAGPSAPILPAGGESVVYEEPTEEGQESTYDVHMKTFARSLCESFDNDFVKVSLKSNASIVNLQPSQYVTISASYNLDADFYLSPAKDLVTAIEYSYAMIDVKNLSLNVVVSAQGQAQSYTVNGLKFKVNYQVDLEPTLFLDLSDPSVKSNVMALFSPYASIIIQYYGQDVYNAFVEKLNALCGKAYVKLSTIKTMLPIGLPEAVAQIFDSADPLGRALGLVDNYEDEAEAFFVELKEHVGTLPNLNVYKDEEGSINRIGVSGSVSMADFVSEYSEETLEPVKPEPRSRDIIISQNPMSLVNFNAGFAVVVGNTHGSESFALESASGNVSLVYGNGGSATASASVDVYYGESAQFSKLESTEDYTIDLVASIEELVRSLSYSYER